MKKTLLRLTLFAAMIGTATIANAQGMRFSAGIEGAFPMGTFGDGAGTGIGGSLRIELPIGDKLGFTGTAGYISFAGKDISVAGQTVTSDALGMIPVQLGLKYYFSEQQAGFYGHVMLGVHMFSTDEVDFDPNTGSSTTKSTMNTKFSYAPEVGYHLANLDFGLRYQLFSGTETEVDETTYEVTEKSTSFGYLGVRIAYVFGGK
jgi:hypothetical protein